MFGQPSQERQRQWGEGMRKRTREEEEPDTNNGLVGFNEHRSKRLQSLPLRSSPPQKRLSQPLSFPGNYGAPATITPSDSDSEEIQQPAMDVDKDTDMTGHHGIPHYLYPGSSQPDAIAPSIDGRMPTPIHATFAAQVRGNSWASQNQGLEVSILSMDSTAVSQPGAFPGQHDPSVPRSLNRAPEWSMVQNRRLPSPISESGGEDPPVSPGMVLDSCSPAMSQLSLQRPQLPHMPHSTNPLMINAIHPNIELSQPSEADIGMVDLEEAHSPSSAPATPSPRSKFGHSRSKHTLNSWTQQSGMVKSFSIGYRADCEKCRLKIPGHFNHIIVS